MIKVSFVITSSSVKVGNTTMFWRDGVKAEAATLIKEMYILEKQESNWIKIWTL